MLAYGLPALPLPAEMEHLAQAWRPYRSVASWYLWRSLEGDAEI
jgi:3-methyladenine DNA glycosylase/8-oxoguanine DNA glycosylase